MAHYNIVLLTYLLNRSEFNVVVSAAVAVNKMVVVVSKAVNSSLSPGELCARQVFRRHLIECLFMR